MTYIVNQGFTLMYFYLPRLLNFKSNSYHLLGYLVYILHLHVLLTTNIWHSSSFGVGFGFFFVGLGVFCSVSTVPFQKLVSALLHICLDC